MNRFWNGASAVEFLMFEFTRKLLILCSACLECFAEQSGQAFLLQGGLSKNSSRAGYNVPFNH